MPNVFLQRITPALVLVIICLLAANAAARMVNKDIASEAHNNAYIVESMPFPNITQVLSQAPSLQSMQFEKDFRRLTYLPAGSINEDVNTGMVHLINEGYILVPKMCWPDMTYDQYLAIQFPDAENNLFRNAEIE